MTGSRVEAFYLSNQAVAARLLRGMCVASQHARRMKRHKIRTIIVGLSLASVARLDAQSSFQLLHSFQDVPTSATEALCFGADGALYGQTQQGGSAIYTHVSTLYKINPDGSGYTTLYEAQLGSSFVFRDSGIRCSGATLYGTYGSPLAGGPRMGAPWGLFKINQDGTGYTSVPTEAYDVPGGPWSPHGQVVESGGVIYGRTDGGGAANAGVIYKINTDGTGYQRLYDFPAEAYNPYGGLYYPHKVDDTGHPALQLSGTVLYGIEGDTRTNTTYVFSVNADGSNFTKIHTFDEASGEYPSGVTVSNGFIFGATTASCATFCGAVFKMSLDGTGYTILYTFDASAGYEHRPLVSVNGVLYGTMALSVDGTIFGKVYKINEDGSGFGIVHDFAGDGIYPSSTFVAAGTTLYGIATVPFDGKASHYGWSLLYKIDIDGTGFASLHEFRCLGGAYPWGIVSAGAHLFGLTAGGANEGGTLFWMNLDGSDYGNLHDFNIATEGQPGGPLTLAGGVLYGALNESYYGAPSYLFRINTGGSGFSLIHAFEPNDPMRHSAGGSLLCGVVESSGFLYGSTRTGGANGFGTVFRVRTDGTGFVTLYDFKTSSISFRPLVFYNGTLYGSTFSGGNSGFATVFKINNDGSDFTILHDFQVSGDVELLPVNNALYGIGPSAGSWGASVFFKINLDGSGFNVLREFDATAGWPGNVMSAGSVLYGTTAAGGASNNGTVFRLSLDGTDFTSLYDFGSTDGSSPSGIAAAGDGALYGDLWSSLPRGGAVFRLLPSQPLPSGPPFGSFETPSDGISGVKGAIAVTGWALSDNGVDHVELWRDPVNGDPAPAANGKIFIGNATFVAGARPDVQALYPNLPRSDRAAWGYMLLTNALPNATTGAAVGGVGTFTLYAYLYDVVGHLTALAPHIFTCDNATAIAFDHSALHFGVVRNGAALSAMTPSQTIQLAARSAWTASSNQPFVSVSPTSGSGAAILTIQVSSPIGLPATGAAAATITVTSPAALNSPQTVTADVQVYAARTTSGPFGSFDTPADGTTGVAGAIAVTGWALDDVGVSSVRIDRDPVSADPPGGTGPNGKVHIGDALFVPGARPDVEPIYPTTPLNDRAAWGYMLLTNMLPSGSSTIGGNGTFTLYAYATDVEGHEILLGSKTIICDNTNATKPFGTIDTPAQGEAVSGTIQNFGWVLTPQPGTVPVDGSSITLFIDGVPKGTALYNLHRDDIATLFPGYSNSSGAVGVFTIDTTTLTNGVHTIAWSVTDDMGRTDGIGSRYFTVLN
jgi:uncharacterized repeat protein (TIGR03803 family)